MKDLNMVFLMGNLTRDPELRYTPNGQAVTTMTIATNRQWTDKDSGDKKDAAEFTDVVVWGKMAENVANYLKKGRRAHVIGRLQTRNWEAQDGSKKYKTEVIATDVTFLDKAPTGSGSAYEGVDQEPDDNQGKSKGSHVPSKSEGKPETTEEEINIEDIPF
jgi:single-strand DNA-binding protein